MILVDGHPMYETEWRPFSIASGRDQGVEACQWITWVMELWRAKPDQEAAEKLLELVYWPQLTAAMERFGVTSTELEEWSKENLSEKLDDDQENL